MPKSNVDYWRVEHQIGVLLDWHRVVHEIDYLVKGFLRVVLESNVMPCILGDQLLEIA